MSSGTLEYRLKTFTGLISHGWPKAALVRDTSDERPVSAKIEVDAQIRSGDYFVTLATQLDSFVRDASDYQIRANIEDVVSDLIYLQDNYTITKNEKSE